MLITSEICFFIKSYSIAVLENLIAVYKCKPYLHTLQFTILKVLILKPNILFSK